MARSNACILHNFSTQKLVEHGEDPNDPGGYFIINGSERVIVGLEDLSYNKIIVDRETVGGNIVFKAKVYSSIVGYRAKLELMMKNDGLIVKFGFNSGLLLPQVPIEYNWNAEEFLGHTCEKAGLPSDIWKNSQTKVLKFQGVIFKEESPNGKVVPVML